MAGCAILGLATSVQLGALYCLLLWMGVLAQSVQGRGKLPLAPMAAMVAVPAGLAGLVALGFPHVWAGFMEHARQTPSLTGWRWPLPDEILKTVRNAPGVLAAAALLIWLGQSGVRSGESGTASGTPVSAAAPPAGEADAAGDIGAIGLVTAAATLAALGIVAGGLFLQPQLGPVCRAASAADCGRLPGVAGGTAFRAPLAAGAGLGSSWGWRPSVRFGRLG